MMELDSLGEGTSADNNHHDESEPAAPEIIEYPVPVGSRPHDVVPAPDRTVWYTAQGRGELGKLDPATGETRHIPLGSGSAPHGVIVGPDGAPWITDGVLNAILRFDPFQESFDVFGLPSTPANVRQILGRPGEIWGAESGVDQLVVIKTH